VGTWVYFDTVACFTTPGYTCHSNNPSSPYGSPYFGEFGANPNVATLQLEEDEAVVVIFRTPPPMRYYSFGQYLYQQSTTQLQLFASLSDALNLRKVGTTGSAEIGASPFDSYAAVVWTADRGISQTVRSMLIDSGLPPQAVNDVPLPQSIPMPSPQPSYQMRMGHGSQYETFNLLMRTALPDVQDDFDAYRQENPYYVIRVGPRTHGAPDPSPVIGYSTDTSGLVEGPALQAALNRLVSDIKANYSGQYSLRAQDGSYQTHLGWDCIATGDSCGGETFDAMYSTDVSRLVKVKSLQDFVIVAGVNHRKTEKATYVSHTVNDPVKLAGIVTVTDVDFTTKSALYHAGIADPKDPRVRQYQNLFAYAFSYDCAGKKFCAPIPAPTPANPVGLSPGAPFYVFGRSYMEPHTLVRPSVSEVVHHQVFFASKR
jgi:hypothetical protein